MTKVTTTTRRNLQVKDIDRGWDSMMRKVLGGHPVVVTGLPAKVASDPKQTRSGKASPLTLVQVAARHELGLDLPRVPQRSFIRDTFDENKNRYMSLAAKDAVRAMLGEIRDSDLLERVGLRMKADIQRRIARGIPPPNAPRTIARKGSSKPLIDTGQLRRSITFEVRRA